MHAFEHFGDIPALTVPANTKTSVTKAPGYDPDLNFALHDCFGIVPAQPYKPREKATVENPVPVVQRWIVAALRPISFSLCKNSCPSGS